MAEASNFILIFFFFFFFCIEEINFKNSFSSFIKVNLFICITIKFRNKITLFFFTRKQTTIILNRTLIRMVKSSDS